MAYEYHRKITIDNTKVSGSENLTNFPYLFFTTADWLKTVSNGGNIRNDNGYDIVFKDNINGNKLDHEIQRYNNSTGEFIAWIRIPTLKYNEDTEIYVYYSNSEISSSQENKTGVWDSNFKAVWHLKEDDTPSDTGFLDPSATGDDYTDFTNPANAYSSNDSDATSASKNQDQDYYNFGITIPANNTVSGIQVDVEAATPDTDTDVRVELSWDGGTSYTSKAQDHTVNGTDAYYTTGGSTDSWGRGWTATELNNTNFRVRVTHRSTNDDLHVDHVRVKVFYRSDYLDSTSNANHGQGGDGISTAMPTQIAGKIGYAQDFDGGDFIAIPAVSNDFDGDVGTASIWMTADAVGAWMTALALKVNGGYDNYLALYWNDPGGTFGFNYSSGGTDRPYFSSDIADDSTWHLVTKTWDKGADEVKQFLDGEPIGGTLTGLGTWAGVIDAYPTIGADGDSGRSGRWNGIIDEVRISNIARSAGWIATEHNNQNSPSIFYTIGGENFLNKAIFFGCNF